MFISVQYSAHSYMYMCDSVHISLPRDGETPEDIPHMPLYPAASILLPGKEVWVTNLAPDAGGDCGYPAASEGVAWWNLPGTLGRFMT